MAETSRFSSRLIAAQRLREWLQLVFLTLGAHLPAARATADSLVEAELCGHPSHGMIRVPEYVQASRDGHLVPGAEPQVLAESPTQLHLAGNRSLGAYAATLLSEQLLVKARAQGVAAGALQGAAHLGRAGDYPRRLALAGLGAIAFVNGGGSVPRVAPFGGRKPFLGTNPVAVAVPGPVGEPPIVVDFSTAAVASGKIRLLMQQNAPLPPGWILDSAGRPSQDPADYYAQGMLVTAAGHKGYGLSLVADVLAGLVSGTGCPGLPNFSGANGFFMVACSLDLFVSSSRLSELLTQWATALRAVPSLDAEHPVQLAGEPESICRERISQEGIPLSESLAGALAKVALSLGLETL